MKATPIRECRERLYRLRHFFLQFYLKSATIENAELCPHSKRDRKRTPLKVPLSKLAAIEQCSRFLHQGLPNLARAINEARDLGYDLGNSAEWPPALGTNGGDISDPTYDALVTGQALRSNTTEATTLLRSALRNVELAHAYMDAADAAYRKATARMKAEGLIARPIVEEPA